MTELTTTLHTSPPLRDEVALRIFCALIAGERIFCALIAGDRFDLYPALGETQIRTCFVLADTFLKVAAEPQEPAQTGTPKP